MRRQPRRTPFQEGAPAGHAGSPQGSVLPRAQAGRQPVLLARHPQAQQAAPGREAARQHLAGSQGGQAELAVLGESYSMAAVPQEPA